MSRALTAVALAVAAVLSLVPVAAGGRLSAQETTTPSGGVMVKGWTGRPDPQAEKQGRTIKDARFWSTDDTLHVSAGPPAAYWNPAHSATGEYVVRATFLQSSAPPERETFGLFVGGSDLDGKVQNYLYCALYGAGQFSIKHRYGGELHSLVERRASPAIRTPDSAGRASNELAWRVDAEKITCLVNGVPLAAFPRELVIGDGKLDSTDGVYGLRVNHNLEVRVTGFGKTP